MQIKSTLECKAKCGNTHARTHIKIYMTSWAVRLLIVSWFI